MRRVVKNEKGASRADVMRQLPPGRQRDEALRILAEIEDEQLRTKASAKEKWWQVSFFDKRSRKKLTLPFPIGGTKAGAIAEAKGRQSGNSKDHVNWVAREVRHNPMKKTAQSKGQGANANGKIKCSKCGGAHLAAYCNAKGRSQHNGRPAKKNLLWLDKKSRRKRATKRAAKRTRKADRLEAEARYLRAIGNPKGSGSKQIEAWRVEGKNAKTIRFWISERTSINDVLTAARRHMQTATGNKRVDNWVIVGHSEQPVSAIQNPMHPLEVGSNLAMILSGVHTAGEMVKQSGQKKKARRPSASAAGRRLAQRKHGSVRGQTKIVKRKVRNGVVEVASGLQAIEFLEKEAEKLGRKKRNGPGNYPLHTARGRKADELARKGKRSKLTDTSHARTVGPRRGAHLPNPNGEIFEEFHGMPSTKILTGYVGKVPGNPKSAEVDLLGPVVQLAIEDPNGQLIQIGSDRDGTAQTIRGRIVKFNEGAVQLNAIENPRSRNGNRRFVVGVRAIDREKWLAKYPWANGKKFSQGAVAEVVYRARKPHLYGGDNRTHTFYHILGEEGGRRPTAYIENGCPVLRYGGYDIRAEGIRN